MKQKQDRDAPRDSSLARGTASFDPSLAGGNARFDPVELLLMRVLRRGIAGTMLTSAAALVACGDDAQEVENAGDPSSAVDGGQSAKPDGQVDARADAGSSLLDARVAFDARTPADGSASLDAQGAGDAHAGPADAAARDASDAAPHDASDAASPADGATPWAVGAALVCPSPSVSQLPVFASRLKPSATYDYVAVREAAGVSFQDAGTGWTRSDFRLVSEFGTRCATASSPACAAQSAKHPATGHASSCVDICTERAIVTTRGDDVKRWATHDELVTLLGPIDTSDEALMLVAGAGYDLACDAPQRSSIREVGDGYEVTATRVTSDCAPLITTQYLIHVARSGELRVLGERVFSMSAACIGRVPAGLLHTAGASAQGGIGEQLAHCAHLEDASVYAFERLARELSAQQAPRELVAASLHAADDEVRHARVTSALARSFGGSPEAARVDDLPLRSLEEIACENAVEGCVRETFGALVGAYQARHAEEPRVRALMQEIAPDEARHAALSQRVHTWALGRLEQPARERVYAAQRAAIAELARACAVQPEGALERALGLPPRAVAQTFVRELSRALWGEALSKHAVPRASEESKVA
jgi:hypothetical protein